MSNEELMPRCEYPGSTCDHPGSKRQLYGPAYCAYHWAVVSREGGERLALLNARRWADQVAPLGLALEASGEQGLAEGCAPKRFVDACIVDFERQMVGR